MDAATSPQTAMTNGGTAAHDVHNGTATSTDLSQVLAALQAIYDPASTNDTRLQATQYLEQAKRHPDAPSHGHTLALDRSQPAQLRHYGLTLLENSIRYRWDEYSPAQAASLRAAVIELAQNVDETDPVYLRNKVAQLWTEVAKREWGDAWMDLDDQLWALWGASLEKRACVLSVLETLSEDVFNREDPVAGLRGSELGRAMVDIFTPAAVLAEQLPKRDKGLDVRYGDEGWLTRLCDNLSWCLSQDYQNQESVRVNAVKTMNTLRACMTWTMPKAIVAVGVIEHVCKALAVPVVELQLASVEVLQSVYTRHHLQDDDFVELVSPMFAPSSISLLREVYAWTIQDMDVHELNDEKYTLCKKLAELCNSLGLFIEQRPHSVPEGSDLPSIFALFFDVLQNPSLVVSIPVLHCWSKLLRSHIVRDSGVVDQMIGGLLEICCARLIRYEALPEDSEDVTYLFLNEDIDTVPERHSFLGNYRRFCADVIEVLVRRTPADAMQHILAQATSTFQNLYNDQPPFQPQNFSKSSTPVLRVDAQVAIVDAALKGYLKWLAVQGSGSDPQDDERVRNSLENSFEGWCRQILQARFEDPDITKKVLQLMSTFSTKALPDRPAFALAFLEHMLTLKLADNPEIAQYSDAVKDLERVCSLEMQRLAMKFPDDFMAVYSSLERKINEMIASPDTDDRQRMAFNAFLFIIIHRSTTIDRDTQEARLKQMLGQVKDAWHNDEFTKSISDFQSFCHLLGMGNLPEFLLTQRFGSIQDWSEQPLPSDGQTMQAAITERSNVSVASKLIDSMLTRIAPAPSPYQDVASSIDREVARWLNSVRDGCSAMGRRNSSHPTQHIAACEVRDNALPWL
jgi:exportin-5